MQDFEYRRRNPRQRKQPPAERKPIDVFFNICADCARKIKKPEGPYSLSLINQTANVGVCPFCFRYGSRDRYKKNN